HLRKEVGSPVVPALPNEPAPIATGTTSYDVHCDVQTALSKLRTDLDSFTDREALSLMYSGYMMASKYVTDETIATGNTTRVPPKTPPWRFFAVQGACNGSNANASSTLLADLDVGRQIAFKVWSLVLPLRLLKWLAAAALVVLTMYGVIFV